MRRFLSVLGFSLFVVACGPGEVGDECRGAPVEDDCVDGALCTRERSESFEIPDTPNSERYFCRQECSSEAECDEGFECGEVAHTSSRQRSCQPRAE